MGIDFLFEKALKFRKSWDTRYRLFATKSLFDRTIPPLTSTSLKVQDIEGLEAGDLLCGLPDRNGNIVITMRNKVVSTWTTPPQDVQFAAYEAGGLQFEVVKVHPISCRVDFIVKDIPRE